MNNKYDIVVIGSGIGGLVSALLLSKSGRKVLIVEKGPGAGGYLKGFRDDGFVFDPSLHLLNGCRKDRYTYDIFSRCGVLKDLEILKPRYLYRSVFPEHDIKVPQQDPDSYKECLFKCFPGSRKGVENFFAESNRVFDEISGLDKGKPISASLSSYFKKSVSDVISRHISDDRLKAVICQSWSYFGLPISKLRAVDFCYPWIDYIINGGHYIRGGGQALVSAFINRLKTESVDLFFNRSADKIIIKDGSCCGVKIGRDIVLCDTVVSGMDLNKTVYDLIGEKSFSNLSLDRIKSIEPSISNFEIFLELNVDMRKTRPDDYEVFVNPDYNIETQYEASIKNNADRAAFTIAVYSNIDNKAAPSDKSIVTISMLSGYDYWSGTSKSEYREKKESIADILLKRAGKVMPELLTSIEKKIIATPMTFERYTGNLRGAIYGYARTVGRSLEARPNDIRDIKNLYFSSAWARQGSGVEKVLRSADETVKRILKKSNVQ
jgi:prolycopene isomerase